MESFSWDFRDRLSSGSFNELSDSVEMRIDQYLSVVGKRTNPRVVSLPLDAEAGLRPVPQSGYVSLLFVLPISSHAILVLEEVIDVARVSKISTTFAAFFSI